MTNEIIEIENDYREGYYEEGYPDDPWSSGSIAGTGKITSQVTGTLRDRVLARVGGGDVVTIVEDRWDSGYCVTCSYEEVDFQIYVDGEEVYNTRTADDFIRYEHDTPFAVLNAWLNNEMGSA